MQRRRRIAGKRGNKKREQPHHGYTLYAGRAIRFYWIGSYHGRSQDQVERRLSIGCTIWQATPTMMQTEWTLATLISAWMSWTYLPEKD